MFLAQNSRSSLTALALLMLLPGFPAPDVNQKLKPKWLVSSTALPSGSTSSYREVHTNGSDRWISIDVKMPGGETLNQYYFLGNPHKLTEYGPTGNGAKDHYAKVAKLIVGEVQPQGASLIWPTVDQHTIQTTSTSKLGCELRDLRVPLDKAKCGPFTANEAAFESQSSIILTAPSTPTPSEHGSSDNDAAAVEAGVEQMKAKQAAAKDPAKQAEQRRQAEHERQQSLRQQLAVISGNSDRSTGGQSRKVTGYHGMQLEQERKEEQRKLVKQEKVERRKALAARKQRATALGSNRFGLMLSDSESESESDTEAPDSDGRSITDSADSDYVRSFDAETEHSLATQARRLDGLRIR